MTADPIADTRLAGKKSLRLLFVLFAVTLCVVFFGELVVMPALPYLLSVQPLSNRLCLQTEFP